METHTQAPAEQPRLSKSYLIWQGEFRAGVFVTEELFIGCAATRSLGGCLVFLLLLSLLLLAVWLKYMHNSQLFSPLRFTFIAAFASQHHPAK